MAFQQHEETVSQTTASQIVGGDEGQPEGSGDGKMPGEVMVAAMGEDYVPGGVGSDPGGGDSDGVRLGALRKQW